MFAVSVLLVVVLTELVVCMVGFVVVTEFGFVVVLVDVLFAAVTQKLYVNNYINEISEKKSRFLLFPSYKNNSANSLIASLIT